jgi:hypothetical protein
MSALPDDPDKSSGVLDREPDQEKSLDPSGPRIRCPLCGWSPLKDDLWACDCGGGGGRGISGTHSTPEECARFATTRWSVDFAKNLVLRVLETSVLTSDQPWQTMPKLALALPPTGTSEPFPQCR